MDAKVGRIESLRACVGGPNRAASAMAIAVVLMVGHSAPSFAAGDPDHGAKIYRQCAPAFEPQTRLLTHRPANSHTLQECA